MPVKTHSNAVRLALIELSKHGCIVARREVGMFFDVRSIKALTSFIMKSHRVPSESELYAILDPHRIGIPGEADIQGIRPPDGRGIAVEIKIAKDRQSKKQKTWAESFRARGGIAGVVKMDKEGWEDEIRKLVNEP